MGMKLFSSGESWQTASNNPNPSKFKILELIVFLRYTYVEIEYIGCVNYEGVKVLVYKGDVSEKLMTASQIDPHFLEQGLSPVARFAPNDTGRRLALELASGLVAEKALTAAVQEFVSGIDELKL